MNSFLYSRNTKKIFKKIRSDSIKSKKRKTLNLNQKIFTNYSNNISLSQSQFNSSEPIEAPSLTQVFKEKPTLLTKSISKKTVVGLPE